MGRGASGGRCCERQVDGGLGRRLGSFLGRASQYVCHGKRIAVTPVGLGGWWWLGHDETVVLFLGDGSIRKERITKVITQGRGRLKGIARGKDWGIDIKRIIRFRHRDIELEFPSSLLLL